MHLYVSKVVEVDINLGIKGLENLKEFIAIKNKFQLDSIWRDKALFLFNTEIAFVISDPINDYEIDILMYDRALHSCTLNMYGIADCILKGGEVTKIDGQAEEYLKKINFDLLGIISSSKKESLAFFLGLMDLMGDRVLLARANKFDELYRKVMPAVSSKWENYLKA